MCSRFQKACEEPINKLVIHAKKMFSQLDFDQMFKFRNVHLARFYVTHIICTSELIASQKWYCGEFIIMSWVTGNIYVCHLESSLFKPKSKKHNRFNLAWCNWSSHIFYGLFFLRPLMKTLPSEVFLQHRWPQLFHCSLSFVCREENTPCFIYRR